MIQHLQKEKVRPTRKPKHTSLSDPEWQRRKNLISRRKRSKLFHKCNVIMRTIHRIHNCHYNRGHEFSKGIALSGRTFEKIPMTDIVNDLGEIFAIFQIAEKPSVKSFEGGGTSGGLSDVVLDSLPGVRGHRSVGGHRGSG
jgi:hypothetical protein